MPAKEHGVAIIKGGTTDGSVLRGRDVEFELQSVDTLDPRVKSVLYRLAEINHINMKAIAELSSMFEQMVDTMVGMTTVADNMKNYIDQQKRSQADVEGDITTETTNH